MLSEPLLMFFDSTQPRRIKVIQNLLIGNRTVSNLFWGMRYQLLGSFKTFRTLPPSFNDQSLQRLIASEDLQKLDQNQYQLTSTGRQKQHQFLNRTHLKSMANGNLKCDLKRLANRLYLANQVLSEFSYHQRNYYPLQVDWRDVRWVKQWFHQFKGPALIQVWKTTLTTFANSLADDLAWQLVTGLVGYHITGQTLTQQAETLQLSFPVMELRQRLILNHLANFVSTSDSPMINNILNGITDSLTTDSAQRSLTLVLSGMKIDKVAQYRHLRISTVQEHLLEAAILNQNADLRWQQLLSPNHYQVIVDYFGMRDVDEWHYHDLQGVSPQISFFEFRLSQIIRSRYCD